MQIGRIPPLTPLLAALVAFAAVARSQDPPQPDGDPPAVAAAPDPLANGGMEEGEPGEAPPGWSFNTSVGATATLDVDLPFAGAQSVLIDATAPSESDRKFSNLAQSIDAAPWQGKRVRFRAAVKVDELAGGSVQLWMRVDGPDGGASAFDNMGDRPIKTVEWTHHDIVLDVANDAERIVCGMFILGRASAWLDDVTLSAVEAGVPTTGGSSASRAGRGQISPAVRRAMGEAADAPQQPFFTPWLLLPLFALFAFFGGFWPRDRGAENEVATGRGVIGRFALYFTIAYWLLYSMPGPFPAILRAWAELTGWADLSQWGGSVSSSHGELNSEAVGWTAEHVFAIEGDLVPPNGSGDTTFNYISQLNRFVLAFVLGLGASFIWLGRSAEERLLDLLRSYLRYVLAFAMLGYGLAKVGMEINQFPMIGSRQLDKRWGDSSPMNVVWSFMGASRPYTIFAGLSEVLAAVLLIWRRTGTLGAMVAIGVMTNVVMINFCYDVPVKLYSSHLLLMGGLIVIPDIRRLFAAYTSRAAVPAVTTASVWAGPVMRWVRWPLKLAVVIPCFAIPLGEKAVETYEYLQQERPEPEAAEPQPVLLRRGFRWINEVPFNR